jgi:lipopolysaccharide export system ATP-binding protein
MPPRPEGAPALACEGLTVELGGVAVVRGVSLSVAPGEVLGIFGPSGAGKSTLFGALAGEIRPRAGLVRVDGEDVTREPLWRRARRGLGLLPQGPSVLGDLTVADNLEVFRAAAGGRDEPRRTALELGLGDRLGVRAASLSGGERRRLELARAIAGRPRVLLCDEPFAAVDPRGAVAIAARLRRLARDEGAAVVVADHHVAEALDLCDRAALLLAGEVALTLPPDEFRRSPDVRAHYAVLVPSRAGQSTDGAVPGLAGPDECGGTIEAREPFALTNEDRKEGQTR